LLLKVHDHVDSGGGADISENQLRLHPHAADAAVGEIAAQARWKSARRAKRAEDIPFGDLHKLRMIEGIVSLQRSSSRLPSRMGRT
jgi:hypothetical protein